MTNDPTARPHRTGRARALALIAVIPVFAALLVAPTAAAQPAEPVAATDGAAIALAPAAPAGSIMPAGRIDGEATEIYQRWNWANPPSAALYTTAAGWLGIVQPDLANHRVLVTVLNPATRKPIGKRVLKLNPAWTNWGGFYPAPDGNFYLLVGRNNPKESKTLAVVQVQRYNASWKPAGVSTIKAGDYSNGIWRPFQAGAADMVLTGGRLVVHMATEIFAIEGVHHQTNFTFEVNTQSMKATAFESFGYGMYPYASHSFQQFVTANGSQLALLDHGDAYPRSVQLGVMANYPTSRTTKTYDIYPISGGHGDNYTGVEVTGMVSGPSGILVTGRSIRQASFTNRAQPRNAYLIFVNPDTGATRLTWLSNLPAQGYALSDPHLVRVAADRYAVIFDIVASGRHRLMYLLFDSSGTKLAQRVLPGVEFSATDDPVMIGDHLYWVGERTQLGTRYGSGGGGDTVGYVYGLNLSNIAAPKLLPGSPSR